MTERADLHAQTPLPTPVITPAAGTWTNRIFVNISGASSGVAVYYTTDGSTPTRASSRASGSIIIPDTPLTETIRAVAMSATQTSSIASSTYTIVPQLSQPAFSVGTGTFTTSQSIVLSNSWSGAVIHYTTDRTAPTVNSPVYNGTPIPVTKTTTIKAFATKAGSYTNSTVASQTYTIAASVTTPAPTITPGTGTYSTNAPIQITDTLSGAKIYYTLNGSTPTTLSTPYTAPFSLSQTLGTTIVVKAIAAKTGYTTSSTSQSGITLALPAGVIGTAVVNPSSVAYTIPTNFLGFSHFWNTAAGIMGQSSTSVNTIYRQLVDNITADMGGPLVIRVGGEPTAEATSETVEPFVELAKASNVKFLLSVNLASSNVTLAKQQAAAYTANVPSELLSGIEIGNEPDGYGRNGARPSGYTYAQFVSQYKEWSEGITSLSSNPAPISGPVFGGTGWDPNATSDVLASTLQPSIVSQHHYVNCYYASSPLPSNYLLLPLASTSALSTFQPYAAAAHQMGIPFRISELNSICNGGQPGLSNSFSSALWAIDMMFELANIGVDGVNWNSDVDNGPYDLFHFYTWNNKAYLKNVNPLYYGVQFFAGASGNTSQILTTATLTNSNIKVWVTHNALGHAHLVIINKEPSVSGNVEVTLPGYTTGSLTTLEAPNYLSTSGLTMGGQTYDGSPDGTLQGSATSKTLYPANGVWTIPVGQMSAVSVDLHP